jgi:signal recognition particle subunit SRP54
MFETLTDRLGGILSGLTRRGALRPADIDAALREVRLGLLEADVALDVAKDFIAKAKERAAGAEVLRSVTPGQMVVKIVHDLLVETLGGSLPDGGGGGGAGVNLAGNPPVAVLMLGLQGSGKTTTSAKLGLRIGKRERKKVLLASLDVYRPAAQRQLAVLGQQTDIAVLSSVLGEQPLAIAKRAMEKGRLEGFDVVILDTAGRAHLDEDMMAEAAAVSAAVGPVETLLVADALTGQDAVHLARSFNKKIGITGIVLTRVDGDQRGGAALSMRAVTGCPIKLMGVGEKMDELEAFQAERIAGRILGQGDVVGLVEKAQEVISREDAEKMTAKMMKGRFSLDDMAAQFRQLRKMGSLDGLLGMIPGIGKIKKQMGDTGVDDKVLAHQEAIILSMTAKERRNPKVLNGSRRRRIAAGSGTTVQEVNRLLKQFKQMSAMMKKAGKMGKRGPMGMGGPPPGMTAPPHIR